MMVAATFLAVEFFQNDAALAHFVGASLLLGMTTVMFVVRAFFFEAVVVTGSAWRGLRGLIGCSLRSPGQTLNAISVQALLSGISMAGVGVGFYVATSAMMALPGRPWWRLFVMFLVAWLAPLPMWVVAYGQRFGVVQHLARVAASDAAVLQDDGTVAGM